MASGKWRWLVKVLLWCGAGMLLLMLVLAFSWGVFSSAPAPWQAGLDATYIDGPRRDDGSIDYIAALNEEMKQDIAFEKNAASYYLDAWPTENENRFMLEEYEFRFNWDRTRFPHKLRTPQEDWYTEQTTWLSEGTVVGADLQQLRKWVSQQQPIVEHIRKGTEQKYCYIPIVPTEREGPLITALLSPVQSARGYAQLFHTRAMLAILDGDLDSAHADAMAIRRLARHLSSNPIMITLLMGYALDGMANQIDQRIFASRGITADQVRRYLTDIEGFPKFRDASDCLGHSERIAALDAAMHLARGEGDFIALGTNVPPFVVKAVDWEIVLIEVNKQYDHLAKLLAIENLDERDAAIARAEQSVGKFREQIPTRVAHSIFSRKSRSMLAKDVLMALMMPAMSQMLQAESACEANLQLTQLSGLLAIYREENGEYPVQLEALVPKYIEQVPQDPSARKPFVYRKVDDTFLLYGAGHNRVDDGGPAHLRRLVAEEKDPSPDYVDDIGVESPGWQTERLEQTDLEQTDTP